MEGVLRRVPSRGAALPAFIACSVALHAAAVAVVSQAARRAGADPVQPAPPLELVVVEVEAARPPEPVQAPPPPAPQPQPRVAARPPRPRELTPPPPNEPAPQEAPRQAPLVIGLTISSTTTGGSFAAPVGNTLYGKSENKAAAPEQVQPYAAPARWVPAHQLDSQPIVLSEVKIPYPSAAYREGIEGTVVASIVIDEEGKVVSAKVLSGPGHGLNEAAREAFARFRFRPAMKAGQPVSTEIKYKYTFVLN